MTGSLYPTVQLAQTKPADPATAATAAAPPSGDLAAQLQNLLDLGGPIVLVLVCLSVLAVAIMLLKLYQFSRVRIGARRFIDGALGDWTAGRTASALQSLARTRSPIARVLETAITGMSEAGAAEPIVREEAARVAARELKSLGSYLRGLDVIATIAPLLGLLGTVLGMIAAFQNLQATGSRADPSVLAGGIWEALLTTAVGLSVAVPVSVVLNMMESAVERLRHAMEDAVTQIFTGNPAIKAAEPEPGPAVAAQSVAPAPAE